MSTPEPETDGGALPRLTTRAWALIIGALVVVVAGVAFYAFVLAAEDVRWKDVGFSVESPTEITVTYEVYLYTDADADCTLRALNSRFTEVGVTTQHVSRADGTQQRFESTIITTEEATTAQVQFCTPSE